ncbi:conserved membrane protein, putative [Babesia bigemina]|uniref:Conserved membrane protein, putative n=1 Tax=Babesia bigemina TaxID=5866 RepID=A0A061DCM8_BABBI|nr:conserved membrane protein, putative [Babesia bigemina]CDR97887.1 conserved membrane protein, putative [Babesia bigemina]|eukprot:XP_012770073.1 conserved membrane protein, putative [Babesia bigemina]
MAPFFVYASFLLGALVRSSLAFRVKHASELLGAGQKMQTPASPSFSQMGVFLEPKLIPDLDGNMVVSFLHTSPTSSAEAYDSVSLPRNSKKYDVGGIVQGVVKGDPVTVILGTTTGARFDILYEATVSAEQPEFRFQVPHGKFYLKVEGSGYRLPGVTTVERPCKGQLCPFSNADSKLDIERLRGKPGVYKYTWTLQNAAQYGVESLTQIDHNEASVYNAEKPGIESNIDYSDAAAKLKLNYGIELHGSWGSEYANRLLGIVDGWEFYKQLYNSNQRVQKWVLTDEPLYPQDVSITNFAKTSHDSPLHGAPMDLPREENSKYTQIVTLSKLAFTYAVRRTVDGDNRRRTYFSRRLHKAVIRALCLHNPDIMRALFYHMHDINLIEPQYIHPRMINGRPLTKFPYTDYQSWFKHPEELVEIATTWSEYPPGFQKIKGLKYLLRRQDGTVNPDEPTAPAVAYPRGPDTDSYIEFMESGFHNYPDIPSLIIHELGHFVHSNVVPADLFAKWQEIGGWFKDPNDPDGWSTRQQTEFVNAYGHKKNPSEDFATCIADYVLNPNKIKSRAPRKFEFMRNNVMNGSHYVTKASHEFTVLNLGNPDYMYPGRIIRIDVKVVGKVNDDKRAEFRFQLANNGEKSCATNGMFRLTSSAKTFVDVPMVADGARCSHVLKGRITINKTQKRGVWTTDQIIVADENRLERYVGAADFGLRVWVDNGAEDFQPPRALIPTIALSLVEGRENAIMRATWMVADDGILREKASAYAAISNEKFGQHSLSSFNQGLDLTTGAKDDWRTDRWVGSRKVPSQMCAAEYVRKRETSPAPYFNQYAFEGEDRFDGLSQREIAPGLFNCFEVSVNVPLSPAARSGDYHLSSIISFDSAGNSQMLQWPKSQGPYVTYRNRLTQEDNSKPEVRNICVDSEPTNKHTPNGETKVDIFFEIRDVHSGIAGLKASLRDPFGAGYTVYPKFEDQKDWQKIHYQYMLPRGSIPGVWHLSEISVQDHAGNELRAELHERVIVVTK